MHSPSNNADFVILPGQPEGLSSAVGAASGLSEAIELCFPMSSEDARMFWGGINVPINYKYDISVMYEDIVELLQSCLNDESATVYFCSNTFAGTMSIHPVFESFRVTGKWEALSGGKETELNKIPELTVNKSFFMLSWCGPLREVLRVVGRSNLRIRLKRELDELQKLLSRVEGAEGVRGINKKGDKGSE